MATINIAELLAQAKELKTKEKEIKQQLKAQKQAIATEYTDNMDEATKQKQIADAEKVLNSVKQRAQALKEKFKVDIKALKIEAQLQKEVLEWVNYKQNHSLKKIKNQYNIDGNKLTFKREGLKDITIDISKQGWEKVFKQELAKQGINGDNRIADNIVYTAQQTLKTQQSIK